MQNTYPNMNPRVVAYCHSLGITPNDPWKVYKFMIWMSPHIRAFKEREGITVLSDKDTHRRFNEYLFEQAEKEREECATEKKP